ncbi:hypothetical protein PPN31114_00555 [Pandoraea pneumonica]|uniref:Uncharacterized protein n=1 Tax=Pandoraea pneumonica TaxID=2508299 RepID=A0A5E4S423_9BURK|nr:hypothetical protein PPN31114_00555 [Pandoraea pneumonica]
MKFVHYRDGKSSQPFSLCTINKSSVGMGFGNS